MKNLFANSLVLFIFAANTVLAQEQPTKNPLVVGFRSHYGFIIPHSKSIAKVSDANPFGVELNISKVFLKQSSWEKCYCEAQAGLSVSYFNFNNPTVLGSAVSTAVYFEPLIAAKNKLFYSVRGSLGLSYLTKIYDVEQNPDNQFFSMPVSFILGATFNVYYRLRPNMLLNVAANYNHISNGGFKQPNKGMNFPTIGVGFDYAWQAITLPNRIGIAKKPVDYQLRKQVWAFASLKTVNEPDSLPTTHTVIYGVAGLVSKHIGRYNALHIGMELTADGFAKETLQRKNSNLDHHQFVGIVGHELWLGRFMLAQQFGVYLYSPFRTATDFMYQRYGLFYQFTPHLLLGASLKAHRHVADIFDVRVGWKW
jgi:hypothetical protein